MLISKSLKKSARNKNSKSRDLKYNQEFLKDIKILIKDRQQDVYLEDKL